MKSSPDLLHELRIDRSKTAPRSVRAGVWIAAAAAAAALLLAIAAWFLLGRAEPVPVRTAVAKPAAAAGPIAGSVLDATGYVTARRQATVSAKITGKVIEVLIEEGQRVEAGQILARLDPIDADAQRALAASQLDAARAQLGELRARLALAEKTLVRQRELAASKLVAQSALDQAVAERDALRAQLATAQRNVEVAAEALKVSAIGVDNTVIRAPFAGVVTVKAAQPGEMISPISAGGGFTRTGIGTIVDMDSLEVQVDVNESFIGRVQARQPVEAVLNAYPDWKIPGEVIAIVPTADRSKATVKVRIALKEKDARIVPEMGVRVAFLEAAAPESDAPPAPAGVLVPVEAVFARDGGDAVFVVRDERARLQKVRTGGTRNGQRQLLGGLAVGEIVVLAPPAELADGATVATEPGGDR